MSRHRSSPRDRATFGELPPDLDAVPVPWPCLGRPAKHDVDPWHVIEDWPMRVPIGNRPAARRHSAADIPACPKRRWHIWPSGCEEHHGAPRSPAHFYAPSPSAWRSLTKRSASWDQRGSPPNACSFQRRKTGCVRGSQFCSELAEREGFEPSVPIRVQRFSRPPRSTAPAPLLRDDHQTGQLAASPSRCKGSPCRQPAAVG